MVMPDATQIESWVTWCMNLGSPLFTVFACIAIGYFFRAMPKFPNDWMWTVCSGSGSFIFPILAYPHRALYGHDEGLAQWLLRTVIMGLVLGMGAWGAHEKILSKVEDKIPILKWIVKKVDQSGSAKV